jgi:hypothetical protein
LADYIDSRDPKLACVPESFGYTKEEAEKIFPWVDFPTCKKKMKQKDKIIHISPEGELSMTCSGGKGWYWLGPDARNDTLGYHSYVPNKQVYKGPVQLANNEEWAFGT